MSVRNIPPPPPRTAPATVPAPVMLTPPVAPARPLIKLAAVWVVIRLVRPALWPPVIPTSAIFVTPTYYRTVVPADKSATPPPPAWPAPRTAIAAFVRNVPPALASIRPRTKTRKMSAPPLIATPAFVPARVLALFIPTAVSMAAPWVRSVHQAALA